MKPPQFILTTNKKGVGPERLGVDEQGFMFIPFLLGLLPKGQ
jgi:hypothetical protein